MALLRLRLPLQEGLLQLEHGQGREVQLLLPADRGGPADGLLGDLRRPPPPPRHRPVRHRPRRGGGLGRPTSTTCSRRSSTSSSTPRTRRCASRRARDGIPDDWIEAARRSPVYAMCKRWRIALPLHPEYRTLPMVWYVPPLSPVESLVEDGPRRRARPRAASSRAIEELRIPVEYLASFLAAGDPEPVRRSLAAAGGDAPLHAGARTSHGEVDTADRPPTVGMEPAELEAMFRMVAIGDYDDRYVIPKRHGEVSPDAVRRAGLVRDRLRRRGRRAARTPPTRRRPGRPRRRDFDLREQLVRAAERERRRWLSRVRPAEARLAAAPVPARGAARGARGAARGVRDRAGPRQAARASCARFLPTGTRRRRRRARSAATSRRSTSPSAAASTSPTTCYGDRRQRGHGDAASSSSATRRPASSCSDGELPDYLPLMLEFAALAPDAGRRGCSRTTARRSSWCARACTRGGARSRPLLDASSPALPRLTRRQAARGSGASPPRGRRARRSASSRSRRPR